MKFLLGTLLDVITVSIIFFTGEFALNLGFIGIFVWIIAYIALDAHVYFSNKLGNINNLFYKKWQMSI